jgi:hypothetical protein
MMHCMRWIYYSFLVVASSACNRHTAALSDLIDRQEKLADESAHLSQQIRDLRRLYNQELDAKEADFAGYAAAIKELNDTAEGMRQTLLQFGDYKREYRRASRAKAPGLVLGDLPVGSRTLRQATVKEVTDTHIALAHQDGSTRMALADSPAVIQDRFAYDPSLDVLLEETAGTGTDWLLNAMNTAQQYATAQVDSQSTATGGNIAARQATTNAAPSPNTGSNVTAAASYSSYPNGTYTSQSRPAWQRFSHFTGSFWSPLQNRRKVVGTVNTFSSQMLTCP